jgi:hypothetical protein
MRRSLIAIALAFIIGVSVGIAGFYAYKSIPVETTSHSKEDNDSALADYTLWLMIFTGMLAVATIGLGAATVGLYLTGEKQVKITRETLVGDQRAWIVTSLEFARDGLETIGGEIQINVRLKVMNAGRTPAIRAHTTMGLVTDIRKVQAEVKKLADSDKKPNHDSGLIVAPGDFYYRPWVPSVAADPSARHVTVIVIGSVTYEILQDQELHQTAFAYLVGRKDGTEWGGLIDPTTTQLFADELTVSPWAGGFAT